MKDLWEKTKSLGKVFCSNLKQKVAGNDKNIKISLKDKINFLEQFSNLLNSGIPITNALKIIIYQTRKKKIKIFLNSMVSKINAGFSLKDSFGSYSKIFTQFDISIVEMGEVTGKLGDSIETIRDKEEKSRELKSKIIGALTYPMVIISLAIIMIGVFMIYVIPKIQEMYKDAKVNLPDLTQFIINFSEFLQENIVGIVISIILFIVSIIIFKNHPRTKIYFDMFVLKIPIFGGLIRKKTVSLFASSLGILLKNGIIINTALEISSKALENAYYEKELKKIISEVSQGIELSALMGVNNIASGKVNPYFPVELASVVKIGEQTGKLSELLLRISKKFNKEIDNIVNNISTAIEPVVIVLVGLIVGTIIMAIMLPFFNMVNVI